MAMLKLFSKFGAITLIYEMEQFCF